MADGAKSWWARAILVGAVVAVLLMPIGALGTRFGLWGFQLGFLALAGAVVLAVVGLVTGVVAIFVSRKRGYRADMPSLALGLTVSVLIIALMGMQFYAATSVPPIHNISTDVGDPPQFEAIVALRGEGSNPLAYDAERIAPLQEAAYPWLRPLTLSSPPAEVLKKAQDVLENMGLDVVAVDPGKGIVEATDTTFWFGFKDDVVVRVRASGTGSIVDVRSVSRVGQSDLGVNARRIGQILDALSA